MASRREEQVHNPAVLAEMHRYVPVIHQMLDERSLGLRELAARAQISRTRLGVILHRCPQKRRVMQLPEFLSILHALGVEMVHAWVAAKRLETIEMLQGVEIADQSEFLVAFNKSLPDMINEFPSLAGVILRKEWSRPLLRMLLARVAQEEQDRQRRERNPFGSVLD